MSYRIFDPKINRPLHELSQVDAKVAFDWFIDNIPDRLREITELVGIDGVELDFSEESLIKLHDWFFGIVAEERMLGNLTPSPELYSVCNDIGIYLSEFLIKAAKNNIKWLFFNKDVSGVSFQRPVISGFNVKNKNYCIDFDYLLCQYSFRILKTGSKDSSLFSAMIHKAITLI